MKKKKTPFSKLTQEMVRREASKSDEDSVGSIAWLEAQVARMLACDGSCGWYDATEYLKVRTTLRDHIGQERIDRAHDEMRF